MARWTVVATSVAVMAAGCGGSKSDDKSGSKDAGALSGRGPITLATGKDTSGNMQNLVNAWNQQHPKEQARIVELRFFGGLTVDEAALALGVSAKTVLRDWDFARAWLQREMTRDAGDGV
jgi:DNA-directed RNA polymerase specialized sigma24 family protein